MITRSLISHYKWAIHTIAMQQITGELRSLPRNPTPQSPRSHVPGLNAASTPAPLALRRAKASRGASSSPPNVVHFFWLTKKGFHHGVWSSPIGLLYICIYICICVYVYIYVYVYIRIVQPHIINQDVVWKRLGFSHHLDSEGEHLGLVFFSTGEITAAEMGITSGKNGDFLLLDGTSKCDLMDYEWDIPSGKLYNSLRTGKWP